MDYNIFSFKIECYYNTISSIKNIFLFFLFKLFEVTYFDNFTLIIA